MSEQNEVEVRPAHQGPAVNDHGEVIDVADASIIQAMGEGADGFIFRVVGLTRSERRRAKHLYAVEWVLRASLEVVIWTPAQRMAIDLFYRLGIPEARCARALRITRQAFKDRLSGAEGNAEKWFARERPPRYREKKGRANLSDSLDGTDPDPRRQPSWGEPDSDKKYVPPAWLPATETSQQS